MGLLNIKKKKLPTVMTPSDVEIDVELDPVTGEYRDIIRFSREGQEDIILYFKHGSVANIANELEATKQEYFH